ncbi:hypothetical protein AAVH_20352 [Aphelenchoides avenae]|nr:hypothetical protein AAVH_20352 [Aphelenchus avenae]
MIVSFADNGRTGWFVKGTVSIGTATISPPQIHVDFTPGLFLDDAYLKELLKGIPGVMDGDYFPCTTKFNMKLTIDGHDYVLPSDVIVDTADRQGKFCRLMTESGGHGQFTIGESFLLMFCRSLDIGNNHIGFAPNLNIACDPRQPNNHCPGSRFGG